MRRTMLYGLACALLASCQSFQETAGEVSVSRPQVFTRERLVNERLGEVNWLREQLDKPFEQGFRDVREAAAYPGLQDALAGRGGSASIELQPTGDAGAIGVAAERVTVGGRTQIRATFSALHARTLDLVVENEQSITYTLGVNYRRGSGEPVPVAMTGGAQLTVKGTKTPSAPAKAAAPEKAAE